MAFSEMCSICLSVKVRMFVLKKTGLQNLYKTLTNRFMDENDGPIIVCFICHARLIRCRRLQQQAIESKAVLEQLLAGWSTSIPKPHEARDEIQFTPIYHIDIWPVGCDIENDCKDEIFSLGSVKIEEENFEIENSKFEENGNYETEPSEKKFKSNSDGNINDVRKGNLDFQSSTIISNPKVKLDNQLIIKKGKHPAKIMKKKILKQKNSDTTAVWTQVEQIPESQLTEIFNCDICEFKTSQKRLILAHFKVHNAKQVYCCNDCDYKCTIKNNFIYHMKIHTGEKPFSCNICEYKCVQKRNLQRHMKIHTGEKPYSCNICKYKCVTRAQLTDHIKIHTGEKPFSCNICEYKCIRKTDLRRHIKTHTGEKPFWCNSCEFRCITKSNLRTHIKIHTGEKPFSCNICEYKCLRKPDLRRHKNTHRRKIIFV